MKHGALLMCNLSEAGEVEYTAQGSEIGKEKLSVWCIQHVPRESGWPHPSSDWFGAVCLLLEHLSLASDMSVLFKALQNGRGFFCSVTSVPSYWKQPCSCLPFVPWASSVFRLSRSFVLLLVLSFPDPKPLSQWKDRINWLLAILSGSWTIEEWVLWDCFQSSVSFGLNKKDSAIFLKCICKDSCMYS